MKPSPLTLNTLLAPLREAMQTFPDRRKGKNVHYALVDVAASAFSVFFTQCPSFLAHQQAMQEMRGTNNAKTLFGVQEIPTDPHIRALLDAVPPTALFPVFDQYFSLLHEQKILDAEQRPDGTLLLALDGTWYFSSKTVHCPSCCTRKHRDGTITYYHGMLTPVLVAPENEHVFALAPEFIVPQDGTTKQDCENQAAKRWIRAHAAWCREHHIVLLGDDLYAHQPLCELLLQEQCPFLFVCLPTSHPFLYDWLAALDTQDLHTHTKRVCKGAYAEIWTYRYATQLPLRGSADALLLNWCELTITREDTGKELYKNAWVTPLSMTAETVQERVTCGRARWKVENENNNTLKTKGYHLEHNFGHGQQHLAAMLATMNILAFLCHTILECADARYRLLREKLPSRATFFQDLRALLRYLCFADWDHLLQFMLAGLEERHDATGLLLSG
jgi:hypothetical protein